MRKRPEPIALEHNLLDVAAQQGMLTVKNGLFDKIGSITKRPGLLLNAAVSGRSLPVYGLHWWNARAVLVSVVSGRIYKTSDLTGPDTDISAPVKFRHQPVQFACNGYWLYAVDDAGPMLKWDGGLSSSFSVEGANTSAPQACSTVATLNTRILANQAGTNRMWYTRPADLVTPADPLIWEGYVEVKENGEEIVNIELLQDQLVVFKKNSLSIWYDDGVIPFRSVIGGDRNEGIVSRMAACRVRDALFFLSSSRDVIKIENRSLETVSSQMMTRELANLDYVDDCIAYSIGDLVVFTFPTEGRTFVYDPRLQRWSEFTHFDDGRDLEFIGRCSAELPATGFSKIQLLGAKDGNRYLFDSTQYTDNDTPINFQVRTTHYDYDTNRRKKSTRLIVKVSLEIPGSAGSGFEGFTFPPLPPAVRCTVYSHIMVVPTGYTLTAVSGLPDGLSFDSGTGEVSGTVTDFVGTTQVRYTFRDARGASKTFTAPFVVSDFDITVGVS